MLSEEDYLELAGHELGLLVRALDEQTTDEVDAELESDILTIEFCRRQSLRHQLTPSCATDLDGR